MQKKQQEVLTMANYLKFGREPSTLSRNNGRDRSRDDDVVVAEETKEDNETKIDRSLLINLKYLALDSSINEGSTSTVYNGWYKKQPVAVKIIQSEVTSRRTPVSKENFLRGVKMLSRVKHENLVKIEVHTKQETNGQMPKYDLPWKILCTVVNVQLMAEVDTDEVFAQMTLLPEKEALSILEVWFQRPKDIVRKLLSGYLDLGIVGLDTLSEFGQGNEDLVLVHDTLAYGDCHLSIAYGIFENIKSMSKLAQMPQWTKEKPLRVATGFSYLGPKIFKERGFETFSTADVALEAAPAIHCGVCKWDDQESDFAEVEGIIRRQIKMIVRSALHEEMFADPNVFLMGEEVGAFQSAYKVPKAQQYVGDGFRARFISCDQNTMFRFYTLSPLPKETG